MEEDETTFLCGFQRARRYGSTATPQQTRPRYTSVIRHQVLPSDTLQGLALKYGSSMMEIKRANKLWSNESLYLKDFLLIPVLNSSETASTSDKGGSSVNGGCSPSPTGSTRSQSVETSESTVESMNDLFSRIDRTIKTTAKNVKRLERESTLDKVDERDGEGEFVSSQSEHSLRHFSFKSSPSPPQVETRRIRHSLEKLQHTHDQFYQL
uniref:LysM domain-containing protein n=1 Tax=Plectus sambesii TaxID=2011161 RepID=A0A914VSS6_9BILA